jgi:hypothetical protein
MTHQLSDRTDKLMNALSERIGFDEFLLQHFGADKDAAWEEVLAFMEEHDIPRFIAEDGHYLQKQNRQQSPKINEEMLKQRLEAWNPTGFARLWNSVTVKRPDPTLLEKAIQRGRIPAEILHMCMEVPPLGYARVRKEWTKDDWNRAVVFDVAIKDPVEVKKDRLTRLRNEVAALELELTPTPSVE